MYKCMWHLLCIVCCAILMLTEGLWPRGFLLIAYRPLDSKYWRLLHNIVIVTQSWEPLFHLTVPLHTAYQLCVHHWILIGIGWIWKYMYEFWCGVILRDVRSAILTTHQNEYIYFHIQPITFLLHTRSLSQKLFDIYYIAFINKISTRTSILNKQKLKFKTKVKQLLPLPFLRLARNMNVYSKEFHS